MDEQEDDAIYVNVFDDNQKTILFSRFNFNLLEIQSKMAI